MKTYHRKERPAPTPDFIPFKFPRKVVPPAEPFIPVPPLPYVTRRPEQEDPDDIFPASLVPNFN